jgi:glycosyltransferase involved in cell wall biosynthesis
MQVRMLLRNGAYDIVHCHSSKAGTVGRIAGTGQGIPCVYTPHCFGFVGDVGPIRRVGAPIVERALARRSARIVCVCEDELSVATKRGIGSRDQVVVIHNGVHFPSDASPVDERLKQLAAGGPLIGAIGVLRPQKRHDLFLIAVATVLARNPTVRATLVGNGPLERPLRALARNLGLDTNDRFALLPFEPPAQRYLGSLDVLALCSDWESLPIALLEALASGVPQVATSVGGVPEIVTAQTGILVAPGDVEALAGAMLELATEPQRRAAMSAASRVRHREQFTPDRMLSDLLPLYEQVVRESREPAS